MKATSSARFAASNSTSASRTSGRVSSSPVSHCPQTPVHVSINRVACNVGAGDVVVEVPRRVRGGRAVACASVTAKGADKIAAGLLSQGNVGNLSGT